MSHFYGTVDGRAKTQATRCGTKNSGITTQAASWTGAVRTRLWHEESTGTDMCEVSMIPWHGSGVKHVLYTGPVDRFAPMQTKPWFVHMENAAMAFEKEAESHIDSVLKHAALKDAQSIRTLILEIDNGDHQQQQQRVIPNLTLQLTD